MKGISDAIYLFIFFIAFALAIIFSGYFTSKVFPYVNQTLNNTNTSALLQSGEDFVNNLDYVFAIVFIGAGIVAVILSFFVESHPVFFIFAFILAIILVFVGTYLRDWFLSIISNSELSSVANRFPITTTIMQYYPLAILVIILIIAFVMYAKGGGVGL